MPRPDPLDPVLDTVVDLTGCPRNRDLVAFGISHPCTGFDKWRLLPVVDENYAVIDAVRTYF
jgi:D-serine deaminase-like pyridoxal phosphate-dependent protein